MFEARVVRMRQLLEGAALVAQSPALSRHFSVLRAPNPVLSGPLRRRFLVKQIQLAAARFGLHIEVDAFLAAAGVSSLAGLDMQRLELLAGWMDGALDRIATACDCPDAPPAR